MDDESDPSLPATSPRALSAADAHGSAPTVSVTGWQAAQRGWRGRCPFCGRGGLFVGWLRLASDCCACSATYGQADTGDGPAVIVMFFVGGLTAASALAVDVYFQPSYWLHAFIWIPVTFTLSATLLRPVRGMLFALQIHTRARPGSRHARDRTTPLPNPRP